MIAYIFRKLGYGLLVMVMVVLIISSIIYLAPVDPTRLTFGQRSDVATVEAKRNELGLNEPLYVQLGRYLNDISPISILANTEANQRKYHYQKICPIGSKALVIKWPYLRESYQKGRPVVDMLTEAIPRTLLLTLCAISLALVIGLILGILAALRPNSWFDHLAVSASVIGISIPSYVSAMILALVFGYWLQDYTGLEVQGSVYGLDDFGEERYFWRNLILPAIALGIRPIAIITQLTRSAMLEVLSQDYIRTARAKGLSPFSVIVKHALRNALNPVVTAVSGWFAGLLAGAFFVENVFSFNGLGQLTVNAMLSYDIPVVLGAVLFTAVAFVLINLLVDLLYVFLDPRVKI